MGHHDEGGKPYQRAFRSPPTFRPTTRRPSAAAAADRLEEALSDACVSAASRGPCAVLLSGGVDSATLCAIAARMGAVASAITLVVDPVDREEIQRARQVASRFRVPLREIRVRPRDLARFTPAAIRAAGTLLHNALAVAKYCLWRAHAAAGAEPLLSGVGADEVLLGNPAEILPDDTGMPPFLARLHEDARLARSCLFPEARRAYPRPRRRALPSGRSGWAAAQRLFFTTVLPGATLPAECGPARAHGLPIHLPYLDPPIVALGATLPWSLRLNGGMGKILLRAVTERFLPTSIAYQPKVARTIPAAGGCVASRTAFIDLYREHLDDSAIARLPILDPRRVRQHLETFASLDDADARLPALDRLMMRLVSLSVLAAAPRASDKAYTRHFIHPWRASSS